MKAFLLAAGLGTRLRPLTNEIPKCLLPVNGKPLLDYWLRLFQKYGIDEVLINLYHLSEKVAAFIQNQKYGIKIKPFYEKELLGSAGMVGSNRTWVNPAEIFLIAYADNLTNANLRAMVNFHLLQRPVLTMGLFKTNQPRECGIATLDAAGTIVDFTEKPQNPVSDLANAGIYITDNRLFSYIPDKSPCDFGFDVLPELTGKMKGFIIKDYIMDIGNPARYKKAQTDVLKLEF